MWPILTSFSNVLMIALRCRGLHGLAFYQKALITEVNQHFGQSEPRIGIEIEMETNADMSEEFILGEGYAKAEPSACVSGLTFSPQESSEQRGQAVTFPEMLSLTNHRAGVFISPAGHSELSVNQ